MSSTSTEAALNLLWIICLRHDTIVCARILQVPPLHQKAPCGVAIFQPDFIMKRSYGGIPVDMTHNWGKPPLSCLPCRQKKRRCDRNQPCWNCAQRDILCEYPGQNDGRHEQTVPLQSSNGNANHAAVDFASLSEGSTARLGYPGRSITMLTEYRNAGMLDRIQRLETAVFSRANRALEPGNADPQLDGIETRHAVSNLYRTCQVTPHITEVI